MQLFEKDSVEDLLLRGYGDVYIRRTTNISMRLYKSEYLAKIENINQTEYCGRHVVKRFDKKYVCDILQLFADNYINNRDVKERLDIAWKTEKDCSLVDLFTHAGYVSQFETALLQRNQTIQDKIAETNQQRYGGKTPMSSDVVKTKVKQTTKERYGVDNVSQVDEIKKKKAATTMSHFGVENPLQSSIVRDKIAESLRKNYGINDVSVTTPFQIQEILEKTRDTCEKRHGVRNPFESATIQQNIRKHWLDNYGVENPSQVPEIQEIRTQTMLERFGVENPFANKAVKEKIKQTNRERYGVEYVTQNDEIMQKSIKTRIDNGTMHTSKSEDDLYQYLVVVFGEDDVIRQYYSDIYPFACDFYIKSRNLFIELNGTWTHDGHWFNPNSESDIAQLTYWKEKDTEYYSEAIHTWSVADVKKREKAKSENLNYVVFWDTKLSDAMLWLAMGCPDGCDWNYEYSWLPKRDLCLEFKYPELSSQERTCIAIAKAANGDYFYHRELNLWNENPFMRWGTLQANLYSNRYRYLNKLPNELSDVEIVRGLSIAGYIRNYSAFHNTGMKQVINDYGVSFIYDPCAGWGERLATAVSMGTAYVGCDINQYNVNGYNRIIDHYQFDDCYVCCADASKHDVSELLHDCVFTCPPYEDTEIYTEHGAENLNHEEFLIWWENVIKNSIGSNTRIFAYQISQKYKDEMNRVLLNLGWKLDKQIPVGENDVNHMNRAQYITKKKNYEEVQVFVK